MNAGALIFMLTTWAAVIWLAVFCFTKLLKDSKSPDD